MAKIIDLGGGYGANPHEPAFNPKLVSYPLSFVSHVSKLIASHFSRSWELRHLACIRRRPEPPIQAGRLRARQTRAENELRLSRYLIAILDNGRENLPPGPPLGAANEILRYAQSDNCASR